jgi:hypothetical protein
MNAKEKASEIFDKMYKNQVTSCIGGNHEPYGNARKCALVLVDEILSNAILTYSGGDVSDNEIGVHVEYWENVKKEIQNL